MFKKLLLLELELQNWWCCFGRLGFVGKIGKEIEASEMWSWFPSSHDTNNNRIADRL